VLHLVEMVLEFFLGVSQLVDTHLDGEVGAAALTVDVIARCLKDAISDCSDTHRVTSLLLGRRQVALREVGPLIH